jgi:hypothetical protein
MGSCTRNSDILFINCKEHMMRKKVLKSLEDYNNLLKKVASKLSRDERQFIEVFRKARMAGVVHS